MTLEEQTQEEYDERFEHLSVDLKHEKMSSGVELLIREKISNEVAVKYHPDFNVEDIINLVKANVEPTIANKYSTKFSAEDIIEIIQLGFGLKLADKYSRNFNLGDVAWSISSGLNEIEKEECNEKRYRSGVCLLIENNIGPEEADMFPLRFGAYDILKFVEADIKPEQIEDYDARFFKLRSGRAVKDYRYGAFDIFHLINANISQRKAVKHQYGFDGSDIVWIETKLTKKQRRAYKKRFDSYGIQELVKARCTFEEANKYDLRFTSLEIVELFKINCSNEKALEYGNRDGRTIADLLRKGISPKDVSKFKDYLEAYIIKYALENEIPPEKINDVKLAFSQRILFDLIKEGYYADTLNLFEPRFFQHTTDDDVHGICGKYIQRLLEEGVGPELANQYPKYLDANGVMLLHGLKVGPDDIRTERIDFIRLIHDIIGRIEFEVEWNYQFVGSGESGLVMFDTNTNTATKFSTTIKKEYDYLKLVKEKNRKLKNVVTVDKNEKLIHVSANLPAIDWLLRLSKEEKETENQKKTDLVRKRYEETKRVIGVNIEYINGDSLENILQEQNNLSFDKVLQYGADIMNGLIEMRRAGIFYHRDIRPANIMIDEENNKAIIIDLGIATTDRHALPKDNRRYGGSNDLTSLGQVMYKMATGNHLFAKSKSMEETMNADQLSDHRNWIYEDSKRVRYYLHKVDKNIQNKKLATIIKTCLTAKRYEYKNMQNMFQEYRP